MKIHRPRHIFILDLLWAIIFVVSVPFIMVGAFIVISIRELFICINNKLMLS